MLIGEMLVRAKAITPADLDEAISWQVLYGGRLGTNLLELGLVEERVLADALGRQLGCESVSGELELPASMVQAIPAPIARRQEIVPWRIEGKRLKVLSVAPAESMAIFDELGFRLGKIVKPVVAPEFRIHQLLRRYFGSVRQMRALDFGVTPKSKRAQEAERKAEQQALENAADLMDDDAFAAIYAQVMETRAQAAPGPLPVAPTPPTPPSFTPPTPASPVVLVTHPGYQQTPAHGIRAPAQAQLVQPLPAAPPPPADNPWLQEYATPAPEPVLEAADFLHPLEADDELPLLDAELVEDAELVDEGATEAQPTQDQWAAAFEDLSAQYPESEPPAPARPDLSPLSFQEAVAQIGQADSREAVARSVLRYARSKAARAVLLQVQGDVALGWDAVGEDLDPEVARRIAFPLTVPSAFRLVRESRSHYIGPLGKDAGNVRFLKLSGKKWPNSAVLLPVLFRGRVIYILYVDNGHRQHVDADVGELLILSQNITRSMEQLVTTRQQQRVL